MAASELLQFALISLVFIAIPGPNIAVIVATSLQAGLKPGLETVAGTSTAMWLQLIAAAIGTSSFLLLISEGFFWLKWAGVAYLAYLGISSINRFLSNQSTKPTVSVSSFKKGFFVSLTNPKTILFFSAFLPQFVTNPDLYLQQIFILSIVFSLIAITIDCSYAIAVSSVKSGFGSGDFNRAGDGVSGVLYLAASGLLAASHK